MRLLRLYCCSRNLHSRQLHMWWLVTALVSSIRPAQYLVAVSKSALVKAKTDLVN